MTRLTLDANADYAPRIVGIATNRHNFGMPASLSVAVAPPKDDKPARVSLWIEAAVDEIFFVLTLEAWNEMQQRLDGKVKEWAHTDQPAPFPPSNYADSAERQHLVAQLDYFMNKNNELRNQVGTLTTKLDAVVALRQELQTQVNELKAWKERLTSFILREINVD